MRDIENIFQRIYADAKNFVPISEKCRSLGHEILLGPPIHQPPVMFIGYQPGIGTRTAEECRELGYEDRWPTECEFATEDWPLAKRLRQIFGAETLRQCVATNAIFVRCRNVAAYNSITPLAVRREIQRYCIGTVEHMVELIDPKHIVLLGLGTLELFGGEVSPNKRILSDKGTTLLKHGKIKGRDAVGIIHLSGARISKPNFEKVATALKALI